ncbi:MAG: glycosyltransferase family 2 protein [Deltaproteobacteria bacterium]|nr:glycosyltransferase family 2 protein [Deltaproteobacteria bacterium]
MPMDSPKISICIPHWQVQSMMTACLRSIRKNSRRYDLQVIVVDNGSKDESIEYLRGLKWIKLIERPEEVHTNWPKNVFTAWDRGIEEADGEYYMIMHSDVLAKQGDWLDPFLREMNLDHRAGGVGAWKLNLESPVYAWQKRVTGVAINAVKNLFGAKKRIVWKEGHYPRDYCAMYRRKFIVDHGLLFSRTMEFGGGYAMAKQLWDKGYTTRMVPISEMYKKVVHVAHGTAGAVPGKPLRHKRAQKKAEQNDTLDQ